MRSVLLLFSVVSWAVTAYLPDEDERWQDRIVGGQDATMPGAFPFMASLRTRTNEHFCGGWIHNNRFIITSAHCVHSRGVQDVSIHLGTTSRVDQGVVQLPLRIITHPDFQANILANDIAMIQTINQLTFTGLVNVISPNINTIPGGINVIALGWGQTSVSDFFNLLNIISLILLLSRIPVGWLMYYNL